MSATSSFRKMELGRILPTLTLGLVLGAIDLPTVISFAVLIYSGELAPFAGAGIGMILFGGMLVQVIVALTSSVPGMIAGPQDSPAAILGIMAVALLAKMSNASLETKFITVTMMVMITSVLSGAFFLLIGGFKLSRFVRFIPYPVVGGFIAGTGLLLVQGALGIVLGTTPSMTNLKILFMPASLLRWIPSVIFALALLLASRRFQHFLTIPILLTSTAVLFYGIVWANGLSISQIREMGWLLGPFPKGSLWHPPDLALLSKVDWGLIASQASNIAAVALISIVALLLNCNALELIAKRDIDLNRELLATGIANIAGGLAGSSVGYQYLGFSAIPFRMHINSRMIPIYSAAVTGFVLLFGASLLSLIPTLMAGGVLFYLGISFLVEWLYDAWFQLPRIDYILVLIILAVVGGVGFLEGIGTGIVIAVVLFVVNYSRIDIVKDVLTGTSYQSSTERPIEHRQLIRQTGERIHILRLHGFIFFGTSQSLVKQVNDRIQDSAREPLRYLILDFQHVSALDSSAVFSFIRLKQLADTHKFHLVLTDLNQETKKKLTRAGFQEPQTWIHFFQSLDHGMEWCESKLLLEEGGSTMIRAGTLRAQLKKMFPAQEMIDRFMTYLEKEEVQEYHIVIHRGDPPDCMYLIDSGKLTTRLEISKTKFIRLRSQGGGTMVGEMGIFLNQPRTATVVADEPSVLYRLSLRNYQQMMQDEPELAFQLHQWIGRVLSVRLAENNYTLEALLS